MIRERTNTEALDGRPPELNMIGELLGRLTRIEATLEQLLQQKMTKEWYTTDEAAEILGKAPFTVREWCRNRRIKAAKRDCGRGNAREWVISHEELTRVRNEGLLPAGEY
jgi:hypothetical protein